MRSYRDNESENSYETPIGPSKPTKWRVDTRWYVGGMIAGLIGVPCSHYYASYAVWLNAHPMYDDDYWAQQFYIAAVAFLISLATAIGGAFTVASRRRMSP